MARPTKIGRISCNPEANYYKPRGIPIRELEEVVLTEDELEAIRLADLEGLYHEKAANEMRISRQTFGNIIRAAHKKIAGALMNGKALRIEGGMVTRTERGFVCQACNHEWTLPFGVGRPLNCPNCQSQTIFRATLDQNTARCNGGGGGFLPRIPGAGFEGCCGLRRLIK